MSDETTSTGERIPTTIGRYQITGMLGFGAMGAVYKAFDPLIKRTLAVKTIRLDVPKQSPQHRAFIERFYQEARISGTLSHPNIVTLFDIGEEGGLPFLAMEFIDGRTIASHLEQGTRFKPEKVIALVSQVAAALDYAHSRGVVHRDIKPSNLMIHDGEKVKVTDFGIAKLADADITHAGALLGTPSYMSPEQAMGERLDGRSDIFSLGVCAFEMLSGLQPFPGANVTSILYKLVHVDPVEPSDLEANGLVPQKWREVFHKVLAKKPALRYQTASDFVRDLEYCLGSWFTGLGEETISISTPTEVETTVVLAVPDLEPGPPPDVAPASEPVTVLLSPAAPGAPAPPREADDVDDVPATIILRPTAPPSVPAEAGTQDAAGLQAEPEPGAERTMLMSPPPPAEDAAAATIMMGMPMLPPPTPPGPAVAAAGAAVPAESTLHQAAAATETLPRSPRPGLPVGWVLGGALALLLLAAGITGVALWRRSYVGPSVAETSVASPAPAITPPSATTPPPTAAETPPPVAGGLRIESDPPGARVRVNGQAKGQTPLELSDLPLGDYEVQLDQKGYESQSRRVTLSAAAPAGQLRTKLVRLSPASGAAEIVSTPPGATVTIDGKPAGRTPLSAAALPVGSRTVRLTLDGHEPWSGTVDVVAGQKGRVEAHLMPIEGRPKPTPAQPEAVDTARVYADSEVDVKARKVSGKSPSYPSERAPRLRSGERVSVLLQFVVSESGEVQDVKVLESGGKAVDDVVVSAVRSWRYEPATKRGTKIKSLTAFKQTFLGG